ncbi:MAG: FAD-dependent oxidoreductase, partial [Candidatus Neomarinimicrobiota bacterium]
PDIPGLSEVPYLTNEEAFELEELPESIIVLGGRYIALEIAQAFSRLGSKVTVLQRSNRILPNESTDITNGLTAYLSEEGINIITGNQFQTINQEGEQIVVKSLVNIEEQVFKAEKIIVATGRTANTTNMGLEENGVKLNRKGFIEVNDHLQTSIPNIFAVGDVLGENMFVYTAAYEGKLAVSNALTDSKKERDYSVLPWVIFTDPQVAGVGLDEIQAKDRGIDYDTAVLPLSYVPRSIAALDTRGFIKLIRNKHTDRLIGARILAPEGSELLLEVAMAIKFGITTEQLKEMFHPYLTLSEGIKLAAISFSKDLKDLSCCAT